MTLANKNIKRGHIWNALVITIALGILSILPISMISEASEKLWWRDSDFSEKRKFSRTERNG